MNGIPTLRIHYPLADNKDTAKIFITGINTAAVLSTGARSVGFIKQSDFFSNSVVAFHGVLFRLPLLIASAVDLINKMGIAPANKIKSGIALINGGDFITASFYKIQLGQVAVAPR